MRPALIAACLVPLAAAANPTGGTVTSGSATISTSGSTVTVDTGTTGTVINWTSFSIANGETTRINQPSASSATLNRVTGPSQSSINGSLQSNGQVFLINPNGIVFGSTASVDVAGFVASSLAISDADFLSRNLRFTSPAVDGPVSSSGSIVASDYVALVGATVSVSGNITAGSGGIVLAAGAPVTITTAGGVFTSASVGFGVSGAVVNVDGVLSSTGPVIIQTSGGSSLPRQIPSSPLPVVIVGPGTMQISQNSSNAIYSSSSFNIASGSAVNFGHLSATTTTQTASPSGTVTIQGAVTTAGTGPAVAPASVALNLEKRFISF